MARDLTEILQSEDDEQASQSALSGLNSQSQTAIYSLWKYISALLQLLLEQLIDIKIAQNEDAISKAAVGSEPWVRDRALQFQYDAINPQILQLVDFAPVYVPVDVTKRLISRCSVVTQLNYIVTVKVAKNEPPVALTNTELTAFQSYINSGGDGTFAGKAVGFGFAGINYIAISLNSDKLYLAGTIYCNGQYIATAPGMVIAAIYNYIATLPFNGKITLLGITDAIQALNTPGNTVINDISLTDVAIRADVTSFGSKTYLRQAKTDILTESVTYSGYVEEETTFGQMFLDKLIFVSS